MSFDLSMFSADFHGDINEPVITSKPTCLADAVASLTAEEKSVIAKEVFNLNPNYVTDELILTQILATGTVRNLNSPVEVYIDKGGYHTLLVYDKD